MPITQCQVLTASFVEFQRDVGIDTEGVVVVDDGERQGVFAVGVLFAVRVRLYFKIPPVQQHRVGIGNVWENFSYRLVRVALQRRIFVTSIAHSSHAFKKSPFLSQIFAVRLRILFFPFRLGSSNIIDPVSEARDSCISEKWRNASNPLEYSLKLNFRECEIKITSALEIGSGDYKKWKCCYATIDGILFDFVSIQYFYVSRRFFIEEIPKDT